MCHPSPLTTSSRFVAGSDVVMLMHSSLAEPLASNVAKKFHLSLDEDRKSAAFQVEGMELVRGALQTERADRAFCADTEKLTTGNTMAYMVETWVEHI
jgi:hypothetical protein